MIVRVTGVNELLFFLHNDENGVFGQTLSRETEMIMPIFNHRTFNIE